MPYTDTHPRLPFGGRTSRSRHTSHQAALLASKTATTKREKYLAWLLKVGQATDQGAVECLGFLLQSVCSTRNGLVSQDLVETAGITSGTHGAKVTIWKLTPKGKAAAQAVLSRVAA